MKNPPLILVKTWCELLRKNEDPSVREHARKMLLGAFGTEQAIAEFLKANRIL